MAPLSIQNATAGVAISCISVTALHDGTTLCSWADNPATRGTLDILWLCVSTLGLCVWNAVHPDVPYPGTPKWRIIGKRIWWLFVGLFMPEMLVLAALGQFRQAYRLLVRVSRETRVPTEFPWWMRVIERLWPTSLTVDELLNHLRASENERIRVAVHPSPTLELDEIRLLVQASQARPSLPGTSPDPGTDSTTGGASNVPEVTRKHPWTLTHSFYPVIHGFISADGDAFWTTRVDRDGDFRTVFDPEKGILRIRAAPGTARSIPDVSADDLDDRSKAGAVAKALLVWQFSVFIANCAARWNQALPLSLLEITTLAHCLCSLIALGLWWHKPHSVGEATVSVIDRTRSLPPPPKKTRFNRAVEMVLPGEKAMDLSTTFTILVIAVLYGLPHLLGLSLHFPTTAEQLCWKIATSLVIGSPLVVCVFWGIDLLCTSGAADCMGNAVDCISVLLGPVIILVYPIASMFLVAESVRQVFALPVGSFHEPHLTRYLPSFS